MVGIGILFVSLIVVIVTFKHLVSIVVVLDRSCLLAALASEAEEATASAGFLAVILFLIVVIVEEIVVVFRRRFAGACVSSLTAVALRLLRLLATLVAVVFRFFVGVIVVFLNLFLVDLDISGFGRRGG